MTRDFKSEVAQLEAAPVTRESAAALQRLHEAQARAALGVDTSTSLLDAVRAATAQYAAAAQHLDAAVRWQWARGADGDAALMAELRTLQLARAWLLARDAMTVPEARALASEVRRDKRADAATLMSATELLVSLETQPQN